MNLIIRRSLTVAAFSAIALATPHLPGKPASAGLGQENQAIDPVCNISVRKDPRLSFEFQGEIYYFCMNADLEAFRADPEKFLGDAEHRHPESAYR